MLKYQVGTALIAGKERIVLHCQETYLDLQALLSSSQLRQALALELLDPPTSLMQVMEQWTYWRERLPQIAEYALVNRADISPQETPLGQLDTSEIHWRAPLLYPRKLICIGTNYTDHIAEMVKAIGAGASMQQDNPYSFFKPATTTLIGSGEACKLPKYAQLIDWEAELAIVIGQKAYEVRGEQALACIAGYSILNDISARDWINKRAAVGIDWVLSKAFDGSAPMGPYITPAEFVPDPQNLRITLSVNGEVKQDSSTANMVFGVREIVEHLAAIMTLEPGDVIATGTPAGVGFGRKPPELLKAGDYMVAEIEGLGRLDTPIV